MFRRLEHTIFQDDFFDSTRIIVVGVSGGPDSLCLLDILQRAGLPLLVAHLNHGLRPEAGGDEALVRQQAERLGLPFVCQRAEVLSFAQEQSLSTEEAARILRYRFLFEQAACVKAQAVAVGHTADDQVETVLMHLLRGAGLSGLKGMQRVLLPNPWSQDIPLVRPLLEVWREEILAYCQERDLKPAWDSTNQDPTFLRNRIRHELIPLLETYNPRLRSSLQRTAQVLQGDDLVLKQAVQAAWRACLVRQGQGFMAFSNSAFCSQHAGVQRRLIRQAAEQLSPELSELGYEEVERALAFARKPPATRQSDLAAGLRLLSEGSLLWLYREGVELPVERWPQVQQAVPLAVPGSLELAGGWTLAVEFVELTPELRSQAMANPDPFRAWVDASQIQSLVLRSRRPGDRFQPLGLEGHSLKLSDFMVNVKLPRRARAAWPLLCSEDQVVWLPGYALAHPFRLVEGTRTVYFLRLCSNET